VLSSQTSALNCATPQSTRALPNRRISGREAAESLYVELARVAARMTRDTHNREDLHQEMLLALLAAQGQHTASYWQRRATFTGWAFSARERRHRAMLVRLQSAPLSRGAG
jgi:DNA-directed RNA polymerase specialized sigma24 family protein